ncbi:hypothetical protein BBO99_00002634 [Phytophthora kernoviae]|uniref:Histone deacetylase domain-containing protein n=2 Tax=Phytophthora kernoviae TaxID=325452 RepID=A0A421GX90_9STRA|nr:hypothetical protein G195_009437 [Phytophthora kernoviae 00238/432]KAG2528426.1 hypothetical protein JM18_002608 [Phytophthora kernoviae]RLN14128.1 hypothetical protein BBI17_002578 [Phytophthora kernoviae]RLN82794.1 hypothetical protein BBO99_00002634 [Phytophthora kernoviae]
MLRLKGGDFNTPFLHLVLRVGAINAPFSEALIQELFADKPEEEKDFYGGDVRALLLEKMTTKDEEGNTLFHLCARYDLVKCMDLLAAFYQRQIDVANAEESPEGAEGKKRLLKLETLLEKGNKVGFRALHEAMKYRAADAARSLVNKYKVDVNSLNSLHQTPAYVVALADFAEGVEILRGSPRQVPANFALEDTYGYPPPENPERIDTLVDPVFGILRSREFKRPNVQWDHEIERADIADILRVHEYHYVDRVRQNCTPLAASIVGKKPMTSKHDDGNALPGQPATKSTSEVNGDAEECHATFSLDLDTALSLRSYDAASRAAGAVCKAVDEVVAGKCRNAFCIVRPPGHHAGPVGKVVCDNDPEGSLGFCLFNNVAVGAAYARAHLKHRGINKVAILDFDVHHGNGTEEIVRQLVPSTKEFEFETPYGVGKQVVHQYKPWRNEDDADNVFFCSVHGYGHKDPENKEELPKGETQGWLYPGSGESNVKQSPVIWDEGLPFCYEGSAPSRLKWRSAFRDNILPKLREFCPDLIFLSSGFDAHKKELVNWGYVSLLEQDYEWLVGHVKQIANTCCNGRLISVLEGGYNFHGRMVSPFARSVAAHTRALINPAQEQWDEEEIAKEAAHEQALLANYMAPAAPAVMLQTKKRVKADAAISTGRSRSKRARKEVDYVALAKELNE